jgi:hypothetical protein
VADCDYSGIRKPVWYATGGNEPAIHCPACANTRALPTQPDPIPIWDLVIADMRARDRQGFDQYGLRLSPFNGRDALWDAYEEALDLAAYLRQAIFEKEEEVTRVAGPSSR